MNKQTAKLRAYGIIIHHLKEAYKTGLLENSIDDDTNMDDALKIMSEIKDLIIIFMRREARIRAKGEGMFYLRMMNDHLKGFEK